MGVWRARRGRLRWRMLPREGGGSAGHAGTDGGGRAGKLEITLLKASNLADWPRGTLSNEALGDDESRRRTRISLSYLSRAAGTLVSAQCARGCNVVRVCGSVVQGTCGTRSPVLRMEPLLRYPGSSGRSTTITRAP